MDAVRWEAGVGRARPHHPARERDLRRRRARGARGRRQAGGEGGVTAATYRVIGARVRRPRSRVTRWYRRNEPTILRILGILGFFALWQVGSDAGLIDSFLFSSPRDVLAAGA